MQPTHVNEKDKNMGFLSEKLELSYKTNRIEQLLHLITTICSYAAFTLSMRKRNNINPIKIKIFVN